jgi:hypothetical protein
VLLSLFENACREHPMFPVALAGFGASLAIEFLHLLSAFASGRRIPKKYRSFGFWIVRILFAILAGGGAVAFNVNVPGAIYVGVSAPMILQGLAIRSGRGSSEPEQGDESNQDCDSKPSTGVKLVATSQRLNGSDSKITV